MLKHSLAISAVFLGISTIAASEKPLTAEQTKFFEAKIRPVLIEKCYSCHSAETPKRPKGGLFLDTREGVLTGGDNGPAVVPGNAKKSLLVQALTATDASHMPPKENLSAEVIADIEKWVKDGAPDPREGKVKAAPKIDIAKGKEHWAFQPLAKVSVPKGTAWATSDIDRLLETQLASKKLTHAADADKRTLLRRVYFDLIGLPPTNDQVETFFKDTSNDAFEKVVDHLLDSPAFGEKWGRHWLDVARYAESSGKEANMLYPFAWRYRDYVIQAFNSDMPIDRFFREQLAGDLLPSKSDNEKARREIATGYLAIGAKSHNERNSKQFQLDVADEQIDAFSQGMLGLTISCARCHDHKFDPIPTKDYYAVAGIFTSTATQFGTAAGVQARQAAPLIELPKGADVPTGPMMSVAEVEKLKTKLKDLKEQLATEREAQLKSPQAAPIRLLALNQQIGITEKQLGYYESDGSPKKMAMGAADRSFPKDMPIHIRGEVDKTGETVKRGTIQVISTGALKIAKGESGRKELADWVASKENPLTARVYVNRIWQHLFGQGIVTTPNNFGSTGMKPSHPELLDYLASMFLADGWSTKKLIKQIVLSHAYRQSSESNSANFAIDPDNVSLWRMSKRRLDAEAIRDAMYSVAGELDTKPAVGSPIQKLEGNVGQLQRFGGGLSNLADTKHRSVYIPIVRDHVPDALELFDFAEPSLVNGEREGTSVPSQALYLLNNSEVIRLAEDAASRLKKTPSETERIDAAFKLVLTRPATKKESDTAAAFLHRFKNTESKSGKKPADLDKAAWANLIQALFATAEFRYLD